MPRPRRLRRLMTGAFIALAVMTSTVALLATPAAAAPPNYYMVAHDNSSACIDVASQNGHFLQLWHCSHSSEQTWTTGFSTSNHWFQFQDRHFGHCIGAVHSGQTLTGAAAAITCSPLDSATPWDKWGVHSAFNDGTWYDVWFNFGDASKCLARLGGTGNGTAIGLLPCDSASQAQRWSQLDT